MGTGVLNAMSKEDRKMLVERKIKNDANKRRKKLRQKLEVSYKKFVRKPNTENRRIAFDALTAYKKHNMRNQQ